MSNLLKEISKQRRLEHAWHKIKRAADSSGMDNVTFADFASRKRIEIPRIGNLLRSNRYAFEKFRGGTMHKKSGSGSRPIRVSTISDAVVMKVLEIELQSQLSKHYTLDNGVSFGFLEGRQVKDAVEKIRQLYAEGKTWIYVADIEDFFGTVVTEDLLEEMVFPYLPDESINGLVEGALKLDIGNREQLRLRGVKVDTLFPEDAGGIPQGGSVSPLLANVYLNQLDIRMMKDGYSMVRYADDITVMCESEEEAREADRVVREILEGELALRVHKTGEPGVSKSCIAPFEDFKEPVLGIVFRANKEVPAKTQLYPASGVFSRHINALQAFRRTPPNADLLRNLQYLQAKTAGWGASYYFTDYSPKYYEPLDKELLQAVISLMARYGFAPEQNLTLEDLARIGIKTYTQSFQSLKDRKRAE